MRPPRDRQPVRGTITMSTLMLSAKLDRSDGGTPWGFRMHGGKDFGCPLTIQRVTPGSLAAKCGLQVGDIILRIGDVPVESLVHKEAQSRIIGSSNFLELTLQRQGSLKSAPGADHLSPSRSSSRPYSPSPLATGQPAFQSPPGVQSPAQDYNRAAQPFAGPQNDNSYNSPNMYTNGNSLATKTSQMTIGGPTTDPIPPWKSPGAPTIPNSARLSPRPVSPAAPRAPSPKAAPGAVWKPNIPSGPRKMRSFQPGSAKNMPGVSTGVKVPICDFCGIAIRGPFVLAMDKTWCPDHFNCSNPHCKVPLLGIGFVEEGGQLFCEQDYEKYFAPRCGKCGAAILRECVNALKDTFHPECFLCFHCGKPIGSGQFHVEDGKTYCEKDWQAMFQTKCYGCQFPIEPGDRWVEALGQNWHSECFNCSTCQENLEGKGFYAKQGKPFCKKHAYRFN